MGEPHEILAKRSTNKDSVPIAIVQSRLAAFFPGVASTVTYREIDPLDLVEIDPADTLSFGELVHSGSSGQRTITTISRRKDETIGRPFTKAFLNLNEWYWELVKARQATGHHFTFSTFTGVCQSGASRQTGTTSVPPRP